LDPVTYQLQFALPTAALPGDKIEVKFPEGFVLNGYGQRSCRGFTLISINGENPPLTLAKIKPVCGGNSFSFLVPADAIIPSNMVLLFSINTVNPVKANPSMNRFVLRQSRTTSTGTTVLGSKSIPGVSIFPKLVHTKIIFASSPPLAVSGTKSKINLTFIAITGATRLEIFASHANVVETFFDFSMPDFSVHRTIPEIDSVSGDIVGFSDGTATIVSHQLGQTAIDTEFYSGSIVNITLSNVVNCPIPGPSKWSIKTTMASGSDKKDEVKDVPGVTVLGKLTILPSSSIVPNTFGGKGVRLTLIFFGNVDLPENAIIVVTAPSSYVITNGSLPGDPIVP
jgi:hypothetical protein